MEELVEKGIRKLFLDKTDRFLDTLRESGGVISGAFPLACLIDGIDTYGIDVYVPDDGQTFSSFENFLLNGLYFEINNGFDPGYMISDIIHSRKYVKPGQISIFVRTLGIDVSTFIEKYFDLTFCMIQYIAGKGILIPYEEETMRKIGYLRKWVVGFPTTGQELNTKERIRKYRFRGFIVKEEYRGCSGYWEMR